MLALISVTEQFWSRHMVPLHALFTAIMIYPLLCVCKHSGSGAEWTAGATQKSNCTSWRGLSCAVQYSIYTLLDLYLTMVWSKTKAFNLTTGFVNPCQMLIARAFF